MALIAVVIIMSLFHFIASQGIQRAMLYQPQRFSMEDLRRSAGRIGLEPWPTADSSYLGLINRHYREVSRGAVIVFHGNAGAALHRSYYADALVPMGFRVLIAEYPGYGARPGGMTEEIFVKNARFIARRAKDELGSPVCLWGESPGAAVAAATAADPSMEVHGIALITPWDNLRNVAQAVMPIVPVRFFMRDKYDSVKNLAAYQGPKAVLVAEHDEIIPPRLPRKLYESLPESKRFWVFEGASHNSRPVEAGSDWWVEAAEYLEKEAGE